MSFSIFRYSTKVQLPKEEVRRRLNSLIRDPSDKSLMEQVARYQFFVDYSGKVYDDRFRLTRYSYPDNYFFGLLFSGLSIIEGEYHVDRGQTQVRFQVIANDYYVKLFRILIGFAAVFAALAYLQRMEGMIFAFVWIALCFVLMACGYMFLFYVYSRWRFNTVLKAATR